MNNWEEFINNTCGKDTGVFTDLKLSMSQLWDVLAKILMQF